MYGLEKHLGLGPQRLVYIPSCLVDQSFPGNRLHITSTKSQLSEDTQNQRKPTGPCIHWFNFTRKNCSHMSVRMLAAVLLISRPMPQTVITSQMSVCRSLVR